MEYLCFLVKRICFASLSRVCILSISFQYIRNTSVLFMGAFDFDRGLPRFNYSNCSSFVLVIAIRSETSEFAFSLTSYVTITGHALEGYIRERDRDSGWSLSYDSRHGRCSFVYLVNKSFNPLTRLLVLY